MTERLTPSGCVHCDHYTVLLVVESCACRKVCEELHKEQSPGHEADLPEAIPCEIALPVCKGKYLER